MTVLGTTVNCILKAYLKGLTNARKSVIWVWSRCPAGAVWWCVSRPNVHSGWGLLFGTRHNSFMLTDSHIYRTCEFLGLYWCLACFGCNVIHLSDVSDTSGVLYRSTWPTEIQTSMTSLSCVYAARTFLGRQRTQLVSSDKSPILWWGLEYHCSFPSHCFL